MKAIHHVRSDKVPLGIEIKKTNIVLDTNVIGADWYLRSINFGLLERYLKQSDTKLFVPDIVVAETKNLFKKKLIELTTKLKKNINELHRYLPDDDILKEPLNIEEKSNAYNAKLDERLAELNAERPDHSDIPHDVIVERALGPRKPFKEEDKGYRDTLLWEVILRKIATKGTTTFLISDNYNDFAAKSEDKLLHADLKKDLISAGLSEDSVCYYSSVKSFVDEQVRGQLKVTSDDILQSLKDGSYEDFSIQEWFEENREAITDKVNGEIDSVFMHSFSYELQDPRVTYIEDPEKIEVVEVIHYDSDESLYHIEIYATADMSIDVFVTKADYYSGIEELVPLDVWDSDWNQSYVWAVIQLKLPISFLLVFDASKKTVESFEVDNIGELWGWCRFCKAQIMSEAAEECWSCGKSFF